MKQYEEVAAVDEVGDGSPLSPETPVLLSDLLSVAGNKNTPRSYVLLLVAEFLSARSRLKRLRSTNDTAGDWFVDQDRILVSQMLWHPLFARTGSAVLTVMAAMLLSESFWQALLAGLAVSTLRAGVRNAASRSFFRAPLLIGLPCIVLGLAFWPSNIWSFALALIVGWTAKLLVSILLVMRFSPMAWSSSFLGLSRMLKLTRAGNFADMIIGVDKAVGEDPAAAAMFLDRMDSYPPDCEGVVEACRALIAARTGSPLDALKHLESAASQTTKRRRIRGWIGLQSAEVLADLGRSREALDLLETSISELSSRADSVWVQHASLLHIRLAVALGVGEEVLEDEVTRHRWKAIKTANVARLHEAEAWRLRLKVGIGQVTEAKLVARAMAVWLGEHQDVLTSEEHADRQIFLASILLDPASTEPTTDQAISDEFVRHLDPRSDLERAIDMLASATQSMVGAGDTVPKCMAHFAMAQALAQSERIEEAQAFVLSSLRAMQTIRYQLPSSAWRGNWEQIQSKAFALAFDLAWRDGSEQNRCALIVELIEAAKAQSIPVVRDSQGATSAAVFDLLLQKLAGNSASAPRADPLVSPPAVLVARSSWLSDASHPSFPLRAAIEFLAGDGIYWSGIECGEWYHWFLLLPDGTYYYDRRPASEISRPVNRMLRYLPNRSTAEGEDNYRLRRAASPLFERSAVTGTEAAPEPEEYLIYRDVSEAILPEPLRAELLAHSRESPLRLIVGLGGRLSRIPIAAFPVNESRGAIRLVERALVSYLPSFAALASPLREAPMSPSSWYPLDLAVVTPNEMRDTPPDERLTFAARIPPSARKWRRGYVDKLALRDLLLNLDRPSTAYFAGHVHPGEAFEPASGGLLLARGERLTLRDLVTKNDAGHLVFPMPSRVVLAGCSSVGMGATGADASGVDRQYEWFGLAIGVLLAGAHDVMCTLFEVPDIEETSAFDHQLATSLTVSGTPAEALRQVQLDRLDAQRQGTEVMPAIWQAYVHICR